MYYEKHLSAGNLHLVVLYMGMTILPGRKGHEQKARSQKQ